MKRTPVLSLVVGAVLGAGAGFVLNQLLVGSSRPSFTPAYALPVLLAAIGAIVLASAIPIRRATRARPARPVDPFRAMRVVVLAKASSLLGAVVAGFGLGLLTFLLSRGVAPSLGSVGAVVVLAGAGAFLTGAGLAAEQMCTIGKDDDDGPSGGDDPGAGTAAR